MKNKLIEKIICIALSSAMVAPCIQITASAETEPVELVVNGGFEEKDLYGFPDGWESNGKNLLIGGDFELGEDALRNVGASPSGGALKWGSPATGTATVSVEASGDDEKELNGLYYSMLTYKASSWCGVGYANFAKPNYLVNAAYGGEYIMRADYKVSSATAFPAAKMSAYYLLETSETEIKNVTRFESVLNDTASKPSTSWQTSSVSFTLPEKPTADGYTYYDFPHIRRLQYRYDSKPVLEEGGTYLYVDNIRFEKMGRATTDASASGENALLIVGYADTVDEVWESEAAAVLSGEKINVSFKAYADLFEDYTANGTEYKAGVKAYAVFDNGEIAELAEINEAENDFEAFSKEITVPSGAKNMSVKFVFTGKGRVYIDDVSVKAEREVVSVTVPSGYKNVLTNGGFESCDDETFFPEDWTSDGTNLLIGGDFEAGADALVKVGVSPSGNNLRWVSPSTGTNDAAIVDSSDEEKDKFGNYYARMRFKASNWGGIGYNNLSGTNYMLNVAYGGDYIFRADYKVSNTEAFPGKNIGFYYLVTASESELKDVTKFEPKFIDSKTASTDWQTAVLPFTMIEKPTAEGYTYYDIPHIQRMQFRYNGKAAATADNTGDLFVDNMSLEKSGRTTIDDKVSGERAMKIDGYRDFDGKDEVWKSAAATVKGGEDAYFGLSYKLDNVESGAGARFVFVDDSGKEVYVKNVDFGIGSKAWGARSLMQKLPQNASGVYVELYVKEGKGTLWADDVFVSQIPDIEHENVIIPDGITNAIENNGFETVDAKDFPEGWASDGTNLIENGDFEEDAYWYRAGASAGVQEFAYSNDSKDGTRSGNLKWVTYPVTGNTEWACMAYREGQGTPSATAIPVALDSEYIVTMDAKKEGNIKNDTVTVMAELKNGENAWKLQTLLSAKADEEWGSFSAKYKTPKASDEKNGNNPDVSMGYMWYIYGGRSEGTAIEPTEGTTQVFVDNITIEKLSRSATDAYKSGEKSLKIVGYADGIDEVWESESELAVVEGEEIYYGGSLKIEGVKANTLFKVNFYDEDGVFVASDEFAAGRGTKDWKEYTDSVIVPEGAAVARLALIVENGSGTAWFDDVILGKMVEGIYTSKPVFNFDELAVNSGKTLKADAKVYNFEETTDILMSVAIYDGNSLVAVGSDYKKDVSGEEALCADVVIPEGEYADLAKLVAKCFIMDAKTQKPLRNAEAIPGSKTDGVIEMSSLYCDNMVLQQNETIKVSGTAVPGAEIAVGFAGEKMSTVADEDGSFSVSFQERAAGGPYSLTVEDNRGHKKVFKNVMVGEVWIVSGQSNVHSTTSYFTKLGDVTEDNENIRFFTVSKAQADEKVDTLTDGEWKTCTKATANGFSCVGYLLAKDLSKEMPGVAIGVIDTSYSGSDIGEWMEYETAVLTNVKTASEKVAKRFNAMVYPLRGFNYKGVAWYQGESSKYWTYQVWLEAMVKNWRNAFGNSELDFAIVQLPGFGNDGFTQVRESQRLACLDDENMHLSVNIDLGDKDDVHPHDKDILTNRLANVIKKEVYGKDIDCYGPTYSGVSFGNGKIIVSFENAKELKTTDGKAPTEFIIAGADGVFYVADAVINGTTVELSSENVASPVYVRHAFEGFPRPNLTDENGLPAEPFRTDSIDKVYAFEG